MDCEKITTGRKTKPGRDESQSYVLFRKYGKSIFFKNSFFRNEFYPEISEEIISFESISPSLFSPTQMDGVFLSNYILRFPFILVSLF